MSKLPVARTATREPIVVETRTLTPPVPVHHDAPAEHTHTGCTCRVEHHTVAVPQRRTVPTVVFDNWLAIVLFVIALAFAAAMILSFWWGLSEHVTSCGHEVSSSWWGGATFDGNRCYYERGGAAFVLMAVPFGALAVFSGMFALKTMRSPVYG